MHTTIRVCETQEMTSWGKVDHPSQSRVVLISTNVLRVPYLGTKPCLVSTEWKMKELVILALPSQKFLSSQSAWFSNHLVKVLCCVYEMFCVESKTLQPVHIQILLRISVWYSCLGKFQATRNRHMTTFFLSGHDELRRFSTRVSHPVEVHAGADVDFFLVDFCFTQQNFNVGSTNTTRDWPCKFHLTVIRCEAHFFFCQRATTRVNAQQIQFFSTCVVI